MTKSKKFMPRSARPRRKFTRLQGAMCISFAVWVLCISGYTFCYFPTEEAFGEDYWISTTTLGNLRVPVDTSKRDALWWRQFAFGEDMVLIFLIPPFIIAISLPGLLKWMQGVETMRDR